MITIVTGEMHSGKTTRVKNLISRYHRVRGVYTETVFSADTRLGYDLVFLPHRKTVPFMRLKERLKGRQKGIDEGLNRDVCYELGKYVFFCRAFELVASEIDSALEDSTDLIVLDEIGYLELRKKGFYPQLQQLISSGRDFLIAVGSRSLPGIVELFSLTEYDLVEVI